METPIVVAVALMAALGGALLGALVRTMWASQGMKAAQAEARRIEAEARARQKELILEAKDEKLRLAHEAEEEARARRNELTTQERRLTQRDEQLDQRAEMLEQRDRKLIDREREIDKAKEDLARATHEQVVALERVSGMSADDAKSMLLEAVRVEAEHDAVKVARAIERSAREEAQDKARDIILTAMQRVAADHTAEHTVSVVHLPSDEMKGRIIGREGRNIRALEQATGVDLIIDDTPESVVLSGFDPVRREVARIAQRNNLPFKVINGIAAHHQEVEYACIEAPIVQIADAISASRPGARGETMDTYVKRLEDLQAIAESFSGVERSFAVQAGREVRILVRPEEIDDLTATRLARDIVRKIEEQLTY